MTRTWLLLPAVAVAFGSSAPASAGTCVSENVPRRGDVTVCTNEHGCDVHVDPGGRTAALCVISPVDTSPFAVCAAAGPYRACVLTADCAVFVTSGRPPGLCV